MEIVGGHATDVTYGTDLNAWGLNRHAWKHPDSADWTLRKLGEKFAGLTRETAWADDYHPTEAFQRWLVHYICGEVSQCEDILQLDIADAPLVIVLLDGWNMVNRAKKARETYSKLRIQMMKATDVRGFHEFYENHRDDWAYTFCTSEWNQWQSRVREEMSNVERRWSLAPRNSGEVKKPEPPSLLVGEEFAAERGVWAATGPVIPALAPTATRDTMQLASVAGSAAECLECAKKLQPEIWSFTEAFDDYFTSLLGYITGASVHIEISSVSLICLLQRHFDGWMRSVGCTMERRRLPMTTDVQGGLPTPPSSFIKFPDCRASSRRCPTWGATSWTCF